MADFNIEVGDRVRVELPGVPEWKIPAVMREATVTADNLDDLLDDLREQVECGGARVWINGYETAPA
jgi:hypothetical protein